MHNDDCYVLADAIRLVLTECRAEYVGPETVRAMMQIAIPCDRCTRTWIGHRSRLTGRIYLEQVSLIEIELFKVGENVIDIP